MFFQRGHVLPDGFLIRFGLAVGEVQYGLGPRQQDGQHRLDERLRFRNPAPRLCRMTHGARVHISKPGQQAVALRNKRVPFVVHRHIRIVRADPLQHFGQFCHIPAYRLAFPALMRPSELEQRLFRTGFLQRGAALHVFRAQFKAFSRYLGEFL